MSLSALLMAKMVEAAGVPAGAAHPRWRLWQTATRCTCTADRDRAGETARRRACDGRTRVVKNVLVGATLRGRVGSAGTWRHARWLTGRSLVNGWLAAVW
jgi:hypothetical protein